MKEKEESRARRRKRMAESSHNSASINTEVESTSPFRHQVVKMGPSDPRLVFSHLRKAQVHAFRKVWTTTAILS